MNVLVANKAMQNIFVQSSFGAEGKRLGVRVLHKCIQPKNTSKLSF